MPPLLLCIGEFIRKSLSPSACFRLKASRVTLPQQLETLLQLPLALLASPLLATALSPPIPPGPKVALVVLSLGWWPRTRSAPLKTLLLGNIRVQAFILPAFLP